MSETGAKDTERLGRSMLSATLGIFSSRVFGLFRDIFIAWYWGATGVAQAAFNTAFAIPNMLRALFGEGAFSSVFVPMVTGRLAQGKEDDAWRLANRVISLQMAAMALLVVIFAAVSYCLYWCLPNVSETWRLVFLILPVVMPYGLLICVTGSFGAILNSRRKFLLSQAVPVLFNVVQISTILLLVWLTWRNTEFKSLLLFCVSATFAGLVQLLAMMLLCRRVGYVFRFDCGWNDSSVKEMMVKLLPGLAGVAAIQVNNLVDKVLGAHLGPSAVGALAFSQHMVYLPVGLFGVAMGIVCLPALSRAWANKDERKMADSLNLALQMVTFLSLPCVALLLALGEDAITVLFARGAFNEHAVMNSYVALAFYLIGLPAFCCHKVATTPYNARLDTKTPVRVSLYCMVLNLVLNITLMQFMSFAGLALASSICAWLNVTILLYLNKRSLPTWHAWPYIRTFAALLLPAVASGAIAWFISLKMADVAAIWRLLAAGSVGGIVYLAVSFPFVRNIYANVFRRK